jgi:response regulator RpfG family c-di-GMP phosphodiesterase
MMTSKILCVDDDPNLLAGLQRNLRKTFDISVATGGDEALALLQKEGPFAVIVADMQMPSMNGVQLLRKAELLAPDTVRIMLTGDAGQKTAVDALNEGHVFRFLNKPCSLEMLAWALEAGLLHHKLIATEKELLEKTLNGSVTLLMEMLSIVEPGCFGKAQTLREHMKLFAQFYKTEHSWDLELAATLSQIGFITIPESLRLKMKTMNPLSGQEQALLARLPELSFKLLAHIPRLEEVCRMVLYQSKNYDGTGFPADDLKEEEIPVGARILKVLSNLVELEAEGIPRERALEMMQKSQGRYDPRVLDAVFACFDIYIDKTSTHNNPPLNLRLKKLQLGHVLVAHITTLDGIMIVAAGTRITSTLLQRLHNFAELSGIREPIIVEGLKMTPLPIIVHNIISSSKMKILIAEDDKNMRMVIGYVLSASWGFELVEAENGMDAWKLLESGLRPDLCIIDIMMPVMDGLLLVQRIRFHPDMRHLKIIISSSTQERYRIAEAKSLDLSGYLIKPFTAAKLQDEVRRILHLKSNAPSNEVRSDKTPPIPTVEKEVEPNSIPS